QRHAAEGDAMLLGRRFQRLQLAAGAEVGKRDAVGARGLARGGEAEMQDAARRFQRGERPRMHLAENGGTQRMRFEPRAVVDGDVGGHLPRQRFGLRAAGFFLSSPPTSTCGPISPIVLTPQSAMATESSFSRMSIALATPACPPAPSPYT